MNTHVVITTCIRDWANYETGTLTLRTVRKGFPNADIFIIDNASIRPAVRSIRTAAKEIGATMIEWETRKEHSEVFRKPLSWHIEHDAERNLQLVFLDSDIIFYENVENWGFETALAGRYIPNHTSHYTKSTTVARLHTSFLWVDIDQLRAEIKGHRVGDVIGLEYAPSYLFMPQIVYAPDGHPTFFDTCANLYRAIGGTEFNQGQLDAYTHLFCGSSADIAKKFLPQEVASGMASLHQIALKNPDALKGIWRAQTFEN